MEIYKNIKTLHAKNRTEWRKWLAKNHKSEKSIWLIIYHKSSPTPSIYYDEAVEEAICFGWIDSIAHKRNIESKYQFFAVRKPKSNWSKANRDRAEKMIKEKQMKPAGKEMINLAKKTGTWTALVDVQNSIIPPDLQKAFNKNKTASKNFNAFPPSTKRIILEWIHNAKRPETRLQRIIQTVELAFKNIKANHHRQ
ncbi:MAG TPA: YdeI/OmpD-associated family protein [Cyclobacteriaceae bacterium]